MSCEKSKHDDLVSYHVIYSIWGVWLKVVQYFDKFFRLAEINLTNIWLKEG